jgi:hypothetical protein
MQALDGAWWPYGREAESRSEKVNQSNNPRLDGAKQVDGYPSALPYASDGSLSTQVVGALAVNTDGEIHTTSPTSVSDFYGPCRVKVTRINCMHRYCIGYHAFFGAGMPSTESRIHSKLISSSAA